MKQKIFALGLSLMITLAQFSFVFSQTGSNTTHSTDELAAMLDDPEVVFVINVKKIIAETAPTLFNGDSDSLKLLATAMKSIEDDSGINPYAIEKVILGLKVSGQKDDSVMILQSDSATKLAESIYQNQLAKGTLANQTNPLSERVLAIKSRTITETPDYSANSATQAANEKLSAKIELFKNLAAVLNNLPPSKTNQALIDGLKAETQIDIETIAKITDKFKAAGRAGEFLSRSEKLEKQITDLSPGGAERAAKISEIEKNIAQVEKDFSDYNRNRKELGAWLLTVAWMQTPSSLEKMETALKDLPAAEPRYGVRLRAAKAALAETTAALNKTLAEMPADNAALPAAKAMNLPPDSEEEPDIPTYPKSVAVTRREENVTGKKVIFVTTVKKYAGQVPDQTDEKAMLAIDDKNLLISDPDSLVRALSDKDAGRNQAVRSLIAKSPEALVAVGVDLQKVDYTELSNFLGQQKNAWQAYGALTSTGNDLTLEAILEKTDRPLNLPGKKDESAPAAAELPAAPNPALDNLIFLLIKSIVGIEGRFTVRFEKKKVAAALAESPKILRELMTGRKLPAKARK